MVKGRQRQSEEKADKRKGNRSCNVSKPVIMPVYGALRRVASRYAKL